ncbi:methyltransferase [Candidatus Woesearchaeota archaeon]|nr:methyltransferase [Candidatus Woesearchaeota archaeon]
MISSQSQLAVILSKLKGFSSPSATSEQYMTDSETAAEVIWTAYMKGDLKGKSIADLGCGTGILGIGCLLLGAKKAMLVDKDPEALEIAGENLSSAGLKAKIICSDISGFNEKTDIVIQNPPFGTKTRHSDREFLEKAFQTAPIIYSFHKTATEGFLKAISEDNKYKITDKLQFMMPLKKTMSFHKKKIERIEVSCFRLAKGI